MGNSLTFSQPYIVDEYYSDDDVNYDSSTESAADDAAPDKAPSCGRDGFPSTDSSSSGGTAAAATAALLQNGQEKDEAAELEEEQRRTLERLDSDLSTFEAVEQSILEASKEFDLDLDRKGQQAETEREGAGSIGKSPSGIPRLQRSVSGRSRSESGNQLQLQDPDHVAPADAVEGEFTSSASAQLHSSAPSVGEDQSPPSPSTHQLIHSFSTEEVDGGENSPRENVTKRGVSPRRHSGIPVRQNSFHGSTVPAAAAYLLYQGDSDRETDVFDRPNGRALTRGMSASSDRDTDGEDVTISDLTGRARRSKKRSGIPSAWMGRAQGDVSPHSTRSGSPRSGEAVDANRFPLDRKVLDLKRWHCMSRPQYKTSCGVSSLVSCWNFLFSSLGHGSLKPLTQETAMSVLGFPEPFDAIKFGSFTGNLALLRWFQELNTNFRVKGKCYILYKPLGKNRTPGVTPEMALASLKRGLRDPSMTFIYHCKNHYFSPIGFEDSPKAPQGAYRSVTDDKKETWILIGETSKNFPAIHCKRWEDICTDLNTKLPDYFDIRREWKGMCRRKSSRSLVENLHCIMAFQKVSGSFCTPPGSVHGRHSQLSASRPSRLPVSPGNVTSRLPPPEPLCECEEPGPVLEEEELGLEDLDSSFEDEDVEENGGDESDILEELEACSQDGSVSRV